jgi:hypothetical protein
MCIYIYIYIYVYIYTHKYALRHIYIYIYICIYSYTTDISKRNNKGILDMTYIYVFVYVINFMYIKKTIILNVYLCLYICIYTYVFIFICIQMLQILAEETIKGPWTSSDEIGMYDDNDDVYTHWYIYMIRCTSFQSLVHNSTYV